MTQQTISVETQQIESADITFCDSCGSPVSELDGRDYETLHRNPRVSGPKSREIREPIERVLLDVAKMDPREVEVRMETIQTTAGGALSYDDTTGTFDAPTPHYQQVQRVRGLRDKTRRLMELTHEATGSLATDGEIDVCHRCLHGMRGPEREAYEILDLAQYNDAADDDEDDDAVVSVSLDRTDLTALSLVSAGVWVVALVVTFFVGGPSITTAVLAVLSFIAAMVAVP